jgi:short subunit dehydrogenase-like uncharacterized protein
MNKKLDLVVYGATGFTGRLVAEYLQQRYGSKGEVAWGMAGRSRSKLEAARNEISAAPTLPLLVADAADPQALLKMAQATKVVITTVGPYQLSGEPLLKACIEAGSDYLDLCGEPAWMARMIRQHHEAAVASGARIVFSCGFDSVPFDLGVLFLQHAAMQQHGKPLRQVHGRVLVMKGGFSGGTAASLVATLAAVGRDAQVARDMLNPFSLTPGFQGPPQPASRDAQLDDFNQAWSAPFVMAPINTKNVHRSNHLLGYAYGSDFVYDERMSCGSGSAGALRAKAMARNDRVQNLLLGFGPTRALISRFVLPKQGSGPNAQQRDSGRYKVLFNGVGADGKPMNAIVQGDRDPGYGSTSKIIAECALGLLHDVDRNSTRGGIWTPGAALGMAVIPRLGQRAGLSFKLDVAVP